MKKLLILLLFTFFSLSLFPNPIVGGDTTRINGKLVMYLMADDYGNGWYYGQLLGDRIMEIMEDYVINHAFGGASNYQMARQVFDQYFSIDQKYIDIASGMILGMQDAGCDIFSPTLGEDLSYKDILIANSIPDFTAFSNLLKIRGPGCSNLTSWGASTAADPFLNGSTVISRNLDWENHPLLVNNPLIIVWGGIGGSQQRIITFAYPGMIGALSGINESGIATFQNMGNHMTAPQGTNFYPVNLAQRNGLEAADYNNDGVCSPADISDAVSQHNMASSFIIHSAGPSWLDNPAEILEIHNTLGAVVRTLNDSLPYFEGNLIATNHFRALTSPTYCSRYNRICDSLELSVQMSLQRNWEVLKTAGVFSNLQTIQYSPLNHVLRVSFAEDGIPAYLIEPSQLDAADLFTLVGINEFENNNSSVLSVFPNPVKENTTITISKLDLKNTLQLSIIDENGRTIKHFGNISADSDHIVLQWNTNFVPSGIYFCVLEFTNSKIADEVQKIVVMH